MSVVDQFVLISIKYFKLSSSIVCIVIPETVARTIARARREWRDIPTVVMLFYNWGFWRQDRQHYSSI